MTVFANGYGHRLKFFIFYHLIDQLDGTHILKVHSSYWSISSHYFFSASHFLEVELDGSFPHGLNGESLEDPVNKLRVSFDLLSWQFEEYFDDVTLFFRDERIFR